MYVLQTLSLYTVVIHALKKIVSSTEAGADVGIGVKFPVAATANELNGQAGISDIKKGNTGNSVRRTVSAINF
jgi:hypothetical protein